MYQPSFKHKGSDKCFDGLYIWNFLACLNHKQAKYIMVETTVTYVGTKKFSTIIQAQMFWKIVFTYVPNNPWYFLLMSQPSPKQKNGWDNCKIVLGQKVWNKDVFTSIQTLRFRQIFWWPNLVMTHNKA